MNYPFNLIQSSIECISRLYTFVLGRWLRGLNILRLSTCLYDNAVMEASGSEGNPSVLLHNLDNKELFSIMANCSASEPQVEIKFFLEQVRLLKRVSCYI